ncbi:cilia- and flagella-associated protein 74 [Cololabis saira]|uniref:cilia- and flagella-associated protein 74 n=1 Tax=Cololabis saira TaxID=129043 RepID=UPI002AD55091|nr:cilia- and flagella-associated protein 74 [Cololabis saira]
MDLEDSKSSSDVVSDTCGVLDLHPHAGEDTEGQGTSNDVKEEEPTPDLEWLQELYEEDDDDGDLALVADHGEKWSYAETARMFKLRRNLDQLDSFRQQKELDVEKARENLKLCRQNITSLLETRDNLEKEIEHQKVTDNSVAVLRLPAQHKHLCQRLQNEEELEGQINTKLRQQERELSEVEEELGRVDLLRQELQEEEQLFQVFKAQKATQRLKQEKKVRQNLQQKMKHFRDKQETMLKEEAECQRKIEESRASQRKAAKHLKQTIKRLNQQATEKEQQNRELLEKRIQAVMSLKNNIEANQECLQIQQSKAKENVQQKKLQQRELKETLQAQGIYSIKNMYQQNQLEETKRKQEKFEESQKSKRMEIVAKLLQEEQLMKSRKSNQPPPLKPSTNDKSLFLRRDAEKLLSYLDPSPPPVVEETALITFRKIRDISSSSSASEDSEEMEEPIQGYVDHQSLADSIAEPEFSGLWNQDYKKLVNAKTTPPETEVKKEEPSMVGGKLSSTVKKGPSFISKPDVIFFEDFEVGKIYKKKIVLINISYTVNNCKFVRVSAQLKDFISINFDPPGPLSTGMSYNVQAIFRPMINENLEGEIHFTSPLGPFSVPVRCTIKTCRPEVDSQFIDFGSHMVGQTISRTVTLTNKGALGTLFSLDTSECLTPETSHVQLPSHISASISLEKCSENTSCNSQESFISTHAGEVQPKQQSQELCEASQQEKPAEGPEGMSDDFLSSYVETQIDSSDSSDIRLGLVREGEIGPFQSIRLDVLFTPTIPGETRLDFYIKFSDINTRPIPIKVRAVTTSIPVWVVEPNIDLKICMFDHLYQERVVVQSRASTALKLTFEVCPEMRKHMEILPKTSVIQAQSSFNAQLKFMPRRSLSKDAEQFFDIDTGVLEVPMTVYVAGQVKPAHFTVQAIVTSSDLQLDQTEVDFGYCSVYESVTSTVRLTNLSLLPQDFGFVGVPEFIEVQPNDGFGTLLPQETLEIELIFSAKATKNYHFQFNCKSGTNRDLVLSCQAVGVQPPLELSHSLVQFRATAVGDQSTARLYLTNRHADHNQPKLTVTSAVKDARGFCFTLPQDSDISITPSVGRLDPGERCCVMVAFKPRLLEQDIKEEALRLAHQATMRSEEKLERTQVEPNKEKRGIMNPKSRTAKDQKTNKLKESAVPVHIQPGSAQWKEAEVSLLRSFSQRFREYTIPCFVSDDDPSETDRQLRPTWSPTNTLYLKVHCPALQPPLVVTSNNGHNVIEFQQVVVGEKLIKKFTVQNISKESLDLKSSVLDIHGSFELLTTLRSIGPGKEQTLAVAFRPTLVQKYCDVLELQCHKMVIQMSLHGEGVDPAVTSSPSGGLLDFGYVLKEETASQRVQLHNSSAVAVGFRALLASQALSRSQDGADTLALPLDGYRGSQLQLTKGTQNYSGLSVFTVKPVEGSIAPGKSQDLTITFQPDHPSVNYCDRLTIELPNKHKVMELKGAASSRIMYLCGGDLTVPTESLLPPSITSQPQLTESEVMESIPFLVTLRADCRAGVIKPAVRELQVGCIHSTRTSRKSGQFYWEDVASVQQQGFSVEPIKGTVEAGRRCTISITWTPPSGYKPFEVVQMCVPLTLKGDETNVYSVTLMALVSVTAD